MAFVKGCVIKPQEFIKGKKPEQMDKGVLADTEFLDFWKAFKKVPYQMLKDI